MFSTIDSAQQGLINTMSAPAGLMWPAYVWCMGPHADDEQYTQEGCGAESLHAIEFYYCVEMNPMNYNKKAKRCWTLWAHFTINDLL